MSENVISKSTLPAPIYRYFPKTMLAGRVDSDIQHMTVLIFALLAVLVIVTYIPSVVMFLPNIL